jgi:alpha-amylase/4-alpha-glucanotransferase-like protein
VSPTRGAAVEEYTIFATETNYANTLTRRREPYHDIALEQEAGPSSGGDGGAPSIHEIEEGIRLNQRPPLDAEDRAILVDRVLPSGLEEQQYSSGDYWPVRSWAGSACGFRIDRSADAIEIVCSGDALEKRLRFESDGVLSVSYRWDQSIGQPDDLFAPELSLFAPLELRTEPAAEIWTFPIETVAKSERGLDRTRQGDSVTLRWPIHLGQAGIEVIPTDRAVTAYVEAGRSTDLG